jgi:hypothetical protein
MMLTSILICLCCLLFLVTIYLAWKLYNFSLIIISMEDAIDESLELLDQKYNSMNEILQKPIFFDSIEVRQVVADIKDCHRVILIVANNLTRETKGIETSGETQEENSKEG